MVKSIKYLGYRIDSEGLHPLKEKVSAITEAPATKNVAELKAYLGLLTYYSKFLPNRSTALGPLYQLLKKNVAWSWTKKEMEAFQASKDLLTSSQLLVHFDPTLPLILACDASPYGIGAVLAHRMPDGQERPIGFASRTLTKSEQNYAQLERKGLACVFGVRKFHAHLFGHSFQLITDHQPLLTLLSEHKPTSPLASARIRRWSLLLASYDYNIVYRRTHAHGNAKL